ncbi:hypothetical protein COCCU_13550 [Corynebacterium occultum]|uniref:Uncharacterized protein n=1 Tax=Corynebacterium occultum TaxID=2675219 RepID=A0A6B8WF44_9CORY|nr:hypothetical protein [Corynebacterium occultum]QGU08600.1 hypothetical protein COCCU_13550 [Corynebacterium occultum]
MNITTVDSPWHLAGCQLRSISRPWVLVLLLLFLIPFWGLIAALGNPGIKLVSYAVLSLLLITYIAGDRQIWRALGLNRLAAIRQQLIVSVPVLLLVALLTLPGLSPAGWMGALGITMVILAVDIGLTLDRMTSEGRGWEGISTSTLSGPAARGGVAHRLLWVPMLRWSIPLGAVLGMAWAVTAGHDSYLAMVLRALALWAAVVVPVAPILSGTASLATWQALGLTRKEWSWSTTGAALFAPLISLLIAAAVLGTAGFRNVLPREGLGHLVPAALALAPLWLGIVLVLVAVAGQNGTAGQSLLGGLGAFTVIFSNNILSDPGMSKPWIEVSIGVLLIALGLYLHHRIRHNSNDRRGFPETGKFAK